MKKLAILAAAAIGYALANRAGRKQDLGSSPTPARPEFAPAGTDPFVASAQEVPLRVVEDLPEESTNDSVAPEPVLEEPVPDEPVLDAAVSAEGDEAIEAELDPEPEVEPIVADVVPSTPVAETQEEPEVTQASVGQVSPQPIVEDMVTETVATTWEESWVDDIPVVTPESEEVHISADEPASEPKESSGDAAEPKADVKLSEIAEDIVARVQTAADLAREEEPPVENLDDLEPEVAVAADEESSTEAFVIPKAEDFAEEVFEHEARAEAPKASTQDEED